MARVELVYDADCPNVRDARGALLMAFVEARLPPSWTEWDRKSPECPAYARRYGSPAVLVEGSDVAGARPVEGSDCCRLYDHGPAGLRGVPPVKLIAAALGNRGAGRGRHLQSIAREVPSVFSRRKIEVFSAGCAACEETIELVNRIACPSCEVVVLDMNEPSVAGRAKSLGVHSVPAVVVDGRLADCCVGRGPGEEGLRAAGVGRPI